MSNPQLKEFHVEIHKTSQQTKTFTVLATDKDKAVNESLSRAQLFVWDDIDDLDKFEVTGVEWQR